MRMKKGCKVSTIVGMGEVITTPQMHTDVPEQCVQQRFTGWGVFFIRHWPYARHPYILMALLVEELLNGSHYLLFQNFVDSNKFGMLLDEEGANNSD